MIDKIISELNIEINIIENKIIFNINDKNIGYFNIDQINYISIKNLNNIKIINNPDYNKDILISFIYKQNNNNCEYNNYLNFLFLEIIEVGLFWIGISYRNNIIYEYFDSKKKLLLKFDKYINNFKNKMNELEENLDTIKKDIKDFEINEILEIKKRLNKLEIYQESELEKIKKIYHNYKKFIDDNKIKNNQKFNETKQLIDIETNKHIKDLQNKKIIINKEDNKELLELRRLNQILKIKNSEKTKYNNNKSIRKNIGVFFHIYNINLVNDILKYLYNLFNYGLKFDLYVNISLINQNDKKKIEYINLVNKLENLNIYDNIYITYSNNKGMDIGGFITSYKKKINLGINYNFILKLHTKTNDSWRFSLLYAILGNNKIIDISYNKIKQKNIGIVGSHSINYYGLKIQNYTKKYIKYFNIKKDFRSNFIAGTIFWIKGDILNFYLNDLELLDKIYDEFPYYYNGSLIREGGGEGLPHAFERLFGIFSENLGFEVHGLSK